MGAPYDLRRPTRIRVDRFGMITPIDRLRIDRGTIVGFHRTFTKNDPDG